MTTRRTNRDRRSRQRRDDSSQRAFFLLVGIIVSGSAVGGYLLYSNQPAEVDMITQCPLDRSLIPARHAILVDTTEPLSPSQVIAVQQRLLATIEAANEFDLFDFYTLRADEDSGASRHEIYIDEGRQHAIGEFCIPQDGNWEQTPMQRQLIRDLQGIVADMFMANVEEQEGQQTSPILDGLRFVAADASLHEHEQNILVVSDMLENTARFSMYQDGWHREYDANRAAFFNRCPQFRDGSRIYVLALMRPADDIQNADWVDFWNDMISGCGSGRNVHLEIHKITGGN